MNVTPTYAMPLGLPASAAGAAAHYAALTPGFDAETTAGGGVSAWVPDDPQYRSVHAMALGFVWFVPAGKAGPVGGAVTEPTIYLKLWALDYRHLRKLSAGTAVPKFIRYTNLDPAEVRNAMTAIIAAQPKLAGREAATLQSVMAGDAFLLVSAGKKLGSTLLETSTVTPARVGKRRLDLRFLDGQGVALAPGEVVDLWRMAGGALVDGHPLPSKVTATCFPSLAPVEGLSWVRLRLTPPLAVPLASTITVTVAGAAAYDYRVPLSTRGEFLYVQTPPHAAGTVDINVEYPAGTHRTFAGALRYVEELEPTVRALASSTAMAIEWLHDFVGLLGTPSGASLTAADVLVALDAADWDDRRWRSTLAARAAATGGSLFDPEFDTVAKAARDANDSRIKDIESGLSLAPAGGAASIEKAIQFGPGFFHQVRALMDANRGLAAVVDGTRHFVCVDATFYRFRVLRRTSIVPGMSQVMADLMTANPSVRAMVNGHYFKKYPGGLGTPANAIGEYTIGGISTLDVPLVGDLDSYNRSLSGFGELAGRGERAFVLAGYATPPSKLSSPGPYVSAVAAVPFIRGGRPEWAPPTLTQRMVYGIHRATSTAFFLGGEFDLPTTQRDLIDAGVADAVTADGSGSVMMKVDGIEIVNYATGSVFGIRDQINPVASYFALEALRVAAGAAAVGAQSTAAGWTVATAVAGLTADIALSASGAEIMFTSLGHESGGAGRDVAAALGVPLPLTLRSPFSDLTTPRQFTDVPMSPAVIAVLKITSTATTDGSMTGRIEIDATGGLLALDVTLPLATAP